MAGKAVPSPSIPLMFIRPWTLSFFYSGHCNLESYNKCPLFGEVVQRELAVKWTEDEKRVCTIGKLHTCKHGSCFLYFWVTLAHECMCEYVLMYTAYGLCACRISSNGPTSDVNSAAHNWKSSSGSQSKAFWSYRFHWIYKVQLKSGAIQSHEWHKR